jgi:hypothetical protein
MMHPFKYTLRKGEVDGHVLLPHALPKAYHETQKLKTNIFYFSLK